jgi:hypothetical protein
VRPEHCRRTNVATDNGRCANDRFPDNGIGGRQAKPVSCELAGGGTRLAFGR